jgi:hypothetical protein
MDTNKPGIPCPHCGGPTGVRKTVNEQNRVVRYRRCTGQCGGKLTTIERPIADGEGERSISRPLLRVAIRSLLDDVGLDPRMLFAPDAE